MKCRSQKGRGGNKILPWSSVDWIALGILVAASTAFLWASRGPLWFDEVLSLQWAKNANSPGDLLTLFRHDNNHPGNTLWIWLVGWEAPELALRALSVVSGILSLILIDRIASRIVPTARWVPLVLAAGSYAMLLYFSEARGYGPALAFTLGAFWVLLKGNGVPSALTLPVFWVTSCGGLVFHASALFPMAGLGAWFLVWQTKTEKSVARGIFRTLVWFGPCAVAAILLHLFFLRGMMVAGGPEYSLVRVLAEFFAYTLGLPASPSLLPGSLLAGFALLTTALAFGRFDLQLPRLCFSCVLLVVPAVVVATTKPEYLYFRYFLTVAPFLFLAVGGLAARISELGVFGRRMVWAVVAVFLLVQAPRWVALFSHGRGDPIRALKLIVAENPRAKIASNHDMLVGMVLEHYRRNASEFAGLSYQPGWSGERAPVDWLILSSQESSEPEDRSPLRHGDSTFQHRLTIPTAPVSGAHWLLYQRQEPSPR